MAIRKGFGRTMFLGAMAVASIAGVSDSAWAARAVSVTGQVCRNEGGILEAAGVTRNASSFRQPAPGQVRCSPSAQGQARRRVTAVDRKGNTVASARTSRTGRFTLKLKPGNYVFRAEGALYDLSGKVRGSGLKNVDFVLGIVFLAE